MTGNDLFNQRRARSRQADNKDRSVRRHGKSPGERFQPFPAEERYQRIELLIAVLLMYLHAGYRPSKYMFVLLSQVAAGAATLDEIMPILQERERRSELDRASPARRRAKKKAERR